MGPFIPKTPQLGPGAMGPRGSGVGAPAYAPVPTQAQSAPPNQAASVMAGVADFLTNFQKGKQAREQQNDEAFLSDVAMMQMGIPVDHNKMAKKAKMSSKFKDLDWNNDNTPVQAAQQANQQVAGQQGQAITQGANDVAQQATAQMLMNGGGREAPPPMSGGMPPSLTQPFGSGPGQSPMPTPTPGPSRSLLGRLGDATGFGGGGPTNPNSTGMEFLKSLAAEGQQNKQLSAGERENLGKHQQIKTLMLDVFKKAVSGDSMAMQLASHFPGEYNMKEMPFDGLLSLGRMTGQSDATTAQNVMFHVLGGDQAIQHMRSLAEKLAPHFDDDFAKAQQYVMEVTKTGQSQLKPGMSFEQREKIHEHSLKLMEAYPELPLNFAETYANFKIAGMESEAKKLMDYASKHFQRAGTISREQFNTTNQYHRDALGQAMTMHNETLNLAAQRALTDALGEDVKLGHEMMTGKSSTDATRAAGAAMIASAASKKADINMSFKGGDGKRKVIPLAGKMTLENINKWFGPDQNNLNFTPPGSGMDKFVGGDAAVQGKSIKDVIELGKKWLEDQLDETPTNQWGEPKVN